MKSAKARSLNRVKLMTSGFDAMTKNKLNEAALSLLTNSQSLNDLLFILRNICKNLDLQQVKPYLKQYASFRFVFFGLLAKAKGTLQIVLFRSEALADKNEAMQELHKELLRIQKQLEGAAEHIKEKHLQEGQKEIILVTESYEKLFPKLQREARKLL